MYSTSLDYKTEVRKANRSFAARITIGDKILTDEDIVTMDIIINQGSETYIGNTISKVLDLTFLNKDFVFLANDIVVEVGININGTMTYLPVGTYKADDVKTEKLTTTVTAYDSMYKTEVAYFSNYNGKSTAITNLMAEICSKCGLTFSGTLPTYNINYNNDHTCREMIGYIASLVGGNAFITNDNKLTIKALNGGDSTAATADNYFSMSLDEEPYKIGKITCTTGENTSISKGSLGADSIELQFANPYVTDAIMTDIYNKLNGFNFLGYTCNWQGDLSIEPFDFINITDTENVVRKCIVLGQKLSYNGGITSEISAKGRSKNDSNYNPSMSATEKVKRFVSDLAFVKKALVDVAYVRDLIADKIKFKTADGEEITVQKAIMGKAEVGDLKALRADIDEEFVNKLTADNLKFTYGNGQVLTLQELLSKVISAQDGHMLNLTSDNVVLANALIKDAMIASVNAAKINAGSIDTSKVNIQSNDGNMLLKGSLLQFKDTNNKVRIQMGLDGNKVYSLKIADVKGNILFDTDGTTAKGLHNGIITDEKISNNANINGKKIDINSLVTEINGSTSTIKGSKIQLDTAGQTLEVAFNTLKSNVNNIKIGGRNLALRTSNVYNNGFTNFTGVANTCINLGKVKTEGLNVGDTIACFIEVLYENIVPADGQTAKIWVQGYGNVTEWINGIFPTSPAVEISGTNTIQLKWISPQLNETYLKNAYWSTQLRTDYIKSGKIKWRLYKVERGNKHTSWTPALEDTQEQITTNTTKLNIQQGKIDTLIKDTTITEGTTSTKLKDAYTALKQTVGEISQKATKVETDFNNIQVGGKNLWVLSDTANGYESRGSITNQNNGIHKTMKTLVYLSNSQIVIQVWNPNKVINAGNNTNRIAWFDKDKTYISSSQTIMLNTGKEYDKQILTVPDNAKYMRIGMICGNTDYDDSIKIKVEFGNVPTAYSEAPEDVEERNNTNIGKTVASTVTEYYVSTSNTSCTGGSWSTDSPKWSAGKYLWARNKTILRNGTVQYSNCACIQGAKGDTGATGPQGPKGEQGIQGPAGKNGQQLYTWLKYADSPTSGMSNNPSGKKYIGLAYNKTSATESSNYSDYTWSLIKGDKGDQGIQGIQGPKGEQGVAGKNGTNGKTTYFHIKYSSKSTPSSASDMTETPSTYIGTYVDYTEADSTDPKKYTWSQFKGSQGAKGDQGIAGKNGTDGKTSYLHIAYANSSDGKTDFSVSTSTGKLYIGQYTDHTQSDSTDYTKYKWTKIKGDKGDQGVAGPKGADGKQYYTWIKYATDNKGSNMSDDPTNRKYIGLAYNKTTSTESTNAKDYVWSLIQGADGKNGANGKGIKSVTPEYYLSTSKTSQVGGNWVTTCPQWQANHYLWTRSKITYTDNTSEYVGLAVDSSWEAVNNIQIGGRNLAIGTSNEYNSGYTNFVGVSNTCITLGKVKTEGLNVGDTIACFIEVLYENIVPADGKTAKIWVQGPGNVTEWNLGAFPTSPSVVVNGSNTIQLKWISPKLNENYLKNAYWSTQIRTDYIKSGKIKWRLYKVERGTKHTSWTPAPEDTQKQIDNVVQRVSTAEQKITPTAIVNSVNEAITNSSDGSVKINTVSTELNKNGLTVKNGAFKIVNKDGEVVFDANKDNKGNLFINGEINATINKDNICSTVELNNNIPPVELGLWNGSAWKKDKAGRITGLDLCHINADGLDVGHMSIFTDSNQPNYNYLFTNKPLLVSTGYTNYISDDWTNVCPMRIEGSIEFSNPKKNTGEDNCIMCGNGDGATIDNYGISGTYNMAISAWQGLAFGSTCKTKQYQIGFAPSAVLNTRSGKLYLENGMHLALADMGSKIQSPGYLKFNNGLIIQWGTVTLRFSNKNNIAGTNIKLPITAPHQVMNCQGTVVATSENGYWHGTDVLVCVHATSTSNLFIEVRDSTGALTNNENGQSVNIDWFTLCS